MLHNLTKVSVASISGINYSYLTWHTLGECECRKFASAKFFRDTIVHGSTMRSNRACMLRKKKWGIVKQLCHQLETWLRWSVACRLEEKKKETEAGSSGGKKVLDCVRGNCRLGVEPRTFWLLVKYTPNCVNEVSTWHSQQVTFPKTKLYSTSYRYCLTQCKSCSSIKLPLLSCQRLWTHPEVLLLDAVSCDWDSSQSEEYTKSSCA